MDILCQVNALNKVILQGRLAAEPKQGQTKSGKTFTECIIAVEDNKSIDGKRKVHFFKVVAWSAKAEFISNYFSKGQYILVDGRLVSDTYTDKKGNMRKDVFVLVEGVNFCGSKSSEAMERDIEESLNSYELENIE